MGTDPWEPLELGFRQEKSMKIPKNHQNGENE